ncbi:MAG: hypothetical protein IJT97_03700 [Bacteroidaceae bacterium]|nr:hypothetical protein [Bacteroidaceae bacterium]
MGCKVKQKDRVKQEKVPKIHQTRACALFRGGVVCVKAFLRPLCFVFLLPQTHCYLIFVKLLQKGKKERKKSRKRQKVYKKATF